jgi:hypothetical protein
MRLSIFAKELLSAKFGQGLILLWPFSETNATSYCAFHAAIASKYAVGLW